MANEMGNSYNRLTDTDREEIPTTEPRFSESGRINRDQTATASRRIICITGRHPMIGYREAANSCHRSHLRVAILMTGSRRFRQYISTIPDRISGGCGFTLAGRSLIATQCRQCIFPVQQKRLEWTFSSLSCCRSTSHRRLPPTHVVYPHCRTSRLLASLCSRPVPPHQHSRTEVECPTIAMC
jgi:hypothetical protein